MTAGGILFLADSGTHCAKWLPAVAIISHELLTSPFEVTQ
jgi:hypothetical protein